MRCVFSLRSISNATKLWWIRLGRRKFFYAEHIPERLVESLTLWLHLVQAKQWSLGNRLKSIFPRGWWREAWVGIIEETKMRRCIRGWVTGTAELRRQKMPNGTMTIPMWTHKHMNPDDESWKIHWPPREAGAGDLYVHWPRWTFDWRFYNGRYVCYDAHIFNAHKKIIAFVTPAPTNTSTQPNHNPKIIGSK